MAADDLAKSFAPLVVVVSSMYYGLIGFAKLRELYGWSDEDKRLRNRKAELELCKLEAEVAIIRKNAGLPPLREQGELVENPRAKRRSPIRRVADALVADGPWSRRLLVAVTAICQFVGWSALGILILAGRYYFAKPLSGKETILRDGFVVGAIALVGAGALIAGFRSFAPVLYLNAPRVYRAAALSSFALALILLILGWLDQSKEILRLRDGG